MYSCSIQPQEDQISMGGHFLFETGFYGFNFYHEFLKFFMKMQQSSTFVGIWLYSTLGPLNKSYAILSAKLGFQIAPSILLEVYNDMVGPKNFIGLTPKSLTDPVGHI